MNFVWQGHDSKRKFGVSLKRNDDFRTETSKKNIRFCVLQSRSPRLIFDDCVNLLCQWNGTCNMLFVQLIQKVNLGNTTFISYCVNMFIHGHRQILSYIKLGRHVFSHFSRPQSSRQFLADAASQRSVAPPHKTVGPFITLILFTVWFFSAGKQQDATYSNDAKTNPAAEFQQQWPGCAYPRGPVCTCSALWRYSFGGPLLQKGISCQSNRFDMRLGKHGHRQLWSDCLWEESATIRLKRLRFSTLVAVELSLRREELTQEIWFTYWWLHIKVLFEKNMR